MLSTFFEIFPSASPLRNLIGLRASISVDLLMKSKTRSFMSAFVVVLKIKGKKLFNHKLIGLIYVLFRETSMFTFFSEKHISLFKIKDILFIILKKTLLNSTVFDVGMIFFYENFRTELIFFDVFQFWRLF